MCAARGILRGQFTRRVPSAPGYSSQAPTGSPCTRGSSRSRKNTLLQIDEHETQGIGYPGMQPTVQLPEQHWTACFSICSGLDLAAYHIEREESLESPDASNHAAATVIVWQR